jgi:hypothetical protein
MNKRTPAYVKQNRQNLVSETEYNEATSFRLKTLAAVFNRPVSLVTTAFGELRKNDPSITVVTLKTETKGRPSFGIDRATANRLQESMNIKTLMFRETPVAAETQQEEGLLTEAEFVDTKYFRLKTVAATFDKAVAKVAVALAILRNQHPDLDVRTVESGTRGRPPIEVGLDVVNQLGDLLNVQKFHFRQSTDLFIVPEQDPAQEPVQESVPENENQF